MNPAFHFVLDPANYAADAASGKDTDRKPEGLKCGGGPVLSEMLFTVSGLEVHWLALSLTPNSWSLSICAQPQLAKGVPVP